MRDDFLQMLSRCYENSREPVLLLDKEWNVLWSVGNPGAGYLPAMLGIPEDSWESCTRMLQINGVLYECSLTCNAQDEVRIAMLHQPEMYHIPFDTELFSTAVSSVNAACAELHRRMPDEAEIINAITGNCYKMYRNVYLQKELERRKAGFWQKTCFPAQAVLVDLGVHLEGILGATTDVELNSSHKEAYLLADKDALTIALLSAVSLCYDEKKKDYRQALAVALDKNNDTLSFTISMTPTPEERSDHAKRLDSFGSTVGEQMLLDAFCKEYGGRWMQNRTGDTLSCRIELPAAEPSKILELNSPQERTEGRFFNKYEILLARIRFRGFY